MRRSTLTLAAAAVVALAGCGPTTAPAVVSTPPPPAPTTTATAAPTATPTTTRPGPTVLPTAPPTTPVAPTAAERLTVRAVAAVPGYSRLLFGPPWADVDHNGCDTRDDILARDLTATVVAPGGCKVDSGTLTGPYTGLTVHFIRGRATSSAVQIDHVVALVDAWDSGASTWTPAQREAYANDPRVLLAVTGPANQAKSGSTADQWLPPTEKGRCLMVADQVHIKTIYRLTVTAAERQAMVRVLAGCAQ